MYVTYETNQYVWDSNKKQEIKHAQPPNKIPHGLPKTEFMPTKLVRISDMKIIYGSHVNEGYCALSYSWNQSGDMVLDETKGKYMRIDEGKHKIIGPFKQKIRRRGKSNKLVRRTIKHVKFEGIIQKICQQFNIQYIWYDQMCINQDDKEEKKREIRNMHHIYSHAYCTVALVLDYNTSSVVISDQEYFKRLWTLEEAIKSKRLLFVGQNTHRWEYEIIDSEPIHQLIKSSAELSLTEILFHAHQRTSTKEHDRVFALINLFPDFMNKIKIDYGQPPKDLMIQFYGLLAEKDIGILFFGEINPEYYKSTIQQYTFLPSWTGVRGEHALSYKGKTSFQNYKVVGNTLYVTCTCYVTNNASSIIDDNGACYFTLRKKDLPPIPDDIDVHDNINRYYLCVLVQLPGTSETKRIRVTYHDYEDIFGKRKYRKQASKELDRLSRFMEIKKENLRWYHENRVDYQTMADIRFTLTEDILSIPPFAQCAILSEISFDDDDDDIEEEEDEIDDPDQYDYYTHHPVIIRKQGEAYYTVIGYCVIESKKCSFFDCNLPNKTFLIQ